MPGSRYISARALALGESNFATMEDPASGLYANPAAIAKIRKPTVEPINLQLQLNKGAINGLGSDTPKLLSLSRIGPALSQSESQGLGATLTPTVGFKGIAAGALAQARLQVANEGSQLRYRSLYQLVPAIGFGLRLASGVIRIGYSLQWVNQTSGEVTTPIGSALNYRDRLADGSALSHNAALALTLPYTYLPSFVVIARNIAGARYVETTLVGFARNRTGAPATEEMSLDLAASISPRLGSLGVFHLTAAYRDATNQSGTSIGTRLGAGVELVLDEVLFFRGGFGNGYPSAGLGLRHKRADLGLVWWSEELERTFMGRRDQRFMLQLQVRAF